MNLEQLNEGISRTDAIINKLINKQPVKFKGFATKIVGAKKCILTKSKNIMTLTVGDGKKDKDFPMIDIIVLNVATGVITFTLPTGASKILIAFMDRFVSKLVNEYEKDINKYNSDKSISITSTASSLRLGRGKGDKGANKVLKPGETVEITTKSKKLPSIKESKDITDYLD